MKHLFLAFALLFSAQLARFAQTGPEVQRAIYDPVKGITTVHIVNTSHKEISALNLSFRVTFPNGTKSLPGAARIGIEFLEGIIQDKGGFQAGTSYDYVFAGQPGPVEATVDMVAYTDGTADV